MSWQHDSESKSASLKDNLRQGLQNLEKMKAQRQTSEGGEDNGHSSDECWDSDEFCDDIYDNQDGIGQPPGGHNDEGDMDDIYDMPEEDLERIRQENKQEVQQKAPTVNRNLKHSQPFPPPEVEEHSNPVNDNLVSDRRKMFQSDNAPVAAKPRKTPRGVPNVTSNLTQKPNTSPRLFPTGCNILPRSQNVSVQQDIYEVSQNVEESEMQETYEDMTAGSNVGPTVNDMRHTTDRQGGVPFRQNVPPGRINKGPNINSNSRSNSSRDKLLPASNTKPQNFRKTWPPAPTEPEEETYEDPQEASFPTPPPEMLSQDTEQETYEVPEGNKAPKPGNFGRRVPETFKTDKLQDKPKSTKPQFKFQNRAEQLPQYPKPAQVTEQETYEVPEEQKPPRIPSSARPDRGIPGGFKGDIPPGRPPKDTTKQFQISQRQQTPPADQETYECAVDAFNGDILPGRRPKDTTKQYPHPQQAAPADQETYECADELLPPNLGAEQELYECADIVPNADVVVPPRPGTKPDRLQKETITQPTSPKKSFRSKLFSKKASNAGVEQENTRKYQKGDMSGRLPLQTKSQPPGRPSASDEQETYEEPQNMDGAQQQNKPNNSNAGWRPQSQRRPSAPVEPETYEVPEDSLRGMKITPPVTSRPAQRNIPVQPMRSGRSAVPSGDRRNSGSGTQSGIANEPVQETYEVPDKAPGPPAGSARPGNPSNGRPPLSPTDSFNEDYIEPNLPIVPPSGRRPTGGRAGIPGAGCGSSGGGRARGLPDGGIQNRQDIMNNNVQTKNYRIQSSNPDVFLGQVLSELTDPIHSPPSARPGQLMIKKPPPTLPQATEKEKPTGRPKSIAVSPTDPTDLSQPILSINALEDVWRPEALQSPTEKPSSRPGSLKRPTPTPPERPQNPEETLLKVKPYYRGDIDRYGAEECLTKVKKDGCFLVRDSSKIPGYYSISIYYRGDVRHIQIPLDSETKTYKLGTAAKTFSCVSELVTFYKKNAIDLKLGGKTKLTTPCTV